MIDHIILTVSDVERSLAFYEASLAPLNIKFFMPYKGVSFRQGCVKPDGASQPGVFSAGLTLRKSLSHL